MTALAKRVADLERKAGAADGPGKTFVIKSNGQPTEEQIGAFLRQLGHEFDSARNPVVVLATLFEGRDGEVAPAPLCTELVNTFEAKR
jgi:hypothetical protein